MDKDTERLTEQEQQFATNHHAEIYKFLRIKRLDIEEWYTIVVPGFLKAVRDYNRKDIAKDYPFYVFANRSMNDCVLKEYRARGTYKRTINYMAISLDTEIHDNSGNGDTLQIMDLVPDTDNGFDNYIFGESLKTAINKLSALQNKIVSMLMDGVSKTEIKKGLKLKGSVFESELKIIQEVIGKCL